MTRMIKIGIVKTMETQDMITKVRTGTGEPVTAVQATVSLVMEGKTRDIMEAAGVTNTAINREKAMARVIMATDSGSQDKCGNKVDLASTGTKTTGHVTRGMDTAAGKIKIGNKEEIGITARSTELLVHMKDVLIEVTGKVMRRQVIRATKTTAAKITGTKIMVAPGRIEIVTGGIARRMKYHHGLVTKMQNAAEE